MRVPVERPSGQGDPQVQRPWGKSSLVAMWAEWQEESLQKQG